MNPQELLGSLRSPWGPLGIGPWGPLGKAADEPLKSPQGPWGAPLTNEFQRRSAKLSEFRRFCLENFVFLIWQWQNLFFTKNSFS